MQILIAHHMNHIYYNVDSTNCIIILWLRICNSLLQYYYVCFIKYLNFVHLCFHTNLQTYFSNAVNLPNSLIVHEESSEYKNRVQIKRCKMKVLLFLKNIELRSFILNFFPYIYVYIFLESVQQH